MIDFARLMFIEYLLYEVHFKKVGISKYRAVDKEVEQWLLKRSPEPFPNR
jgi:hypothetical protein